MSKLIKNIFKSKPLKATLYPFSHRWTVGKFSVLCGEWVRGHPGIETRIKVENGGGDILFQLYPRGRSGYEEYISVETDWVSYDACVGVEINGGFTGIGI